jgi:hypothetical protein
MSKDDDLLQEIRDNFRTAYDAVSDQYDEMIDDLNFLNNTDGSQWPDAIRGERAADGRPCLVINKLPAFVDQVEGDIKQNTPSIKIKPVDNKSDPDTAEKITGLIRNIEIQSMADIAYDNAASSAIRCGLGRFRIVTEYCDNDVFEQNIFIKPIKNPFTVFWDPHAQEWDKSDAKFCFVTEKISRQEFTEKYPKASLQEFQSSKDASHWGDGKNEIRIAEYFRKVPETKTIYLVHHELTGDDYVTDKKPGEFDGQVINSRRVESSKIVWYKTNGVEILEGPTDWPGKYIPIIDIIGKTIQIEGKTVHWGIVRHAKDPCRLYNFSRSHDAEMTSLAPKSPYMVTANMIGNYQGIWDQAHKKNFPYLPFEVDKDAPSLKPYREPPVPANSGILMQIQMADQEIHDTTGLQLASLGKPSNEKSGRAIIARVREGERGNYAYSDNIAKAIQQAGRIILDLLPRVYDTARIERVLGEDGSEERVQFNQPVRDEKTGEMKLYDLTVGKYDVVVSVGPSYQTQREEAAEGMVQFYAVLPDAQKLVTSDLIPGNLDWPGSGEWEKRLKATLPPQLAGDDDANGGQPPPPPQPDPAQMAAMQKMQVDMQKAQVDIEKSKADIEKTRAEIEKIRAQTRVELADALEPRKSV